MSSRVIPPFRRRESGELTGEFLWESLSPGGIAKGKSPANHCVKPLGGLGGKPCDTLAGRRTKGGLPANILVILLRPGEKGRRLSPGKD
jgi:hypothetical protein